MLDNRAGFILRLTAFAIGALTAGTLYGLFLWVVRENPTVGNTAPPTYLFVAGFQLVMIWGSVFVRGVTVDAQRRGSINITEKG